MMRMEFERDVEKVVSQPIALEYVDLNGRTQRYTLDYLVYFKSPDRKPMLVEVKERTELLEKFEKLRPKFEAAFILAKQNGWIFKIYDERRIRGTLLDNLRRLRNYSARQVTEDSIISLTKAIKDSAPISVRGFLTQYTSDRAEYLTEIRRIWWLAIHHYIELDLDSPLSESSIIVGACSDD